MTEEYTIEDLEKHSGLSIRTLHYYMQEGLLPSPDKRGKYATYSQKHLYRLDLIVSLKNLHLPLKEIRELLESLTPAEIEHYRDDQEDLLYKLKAKKPDQNKSSSDTPSSALAYIKSLENAQNKFYRVKQDQTYPPNTFKNKNKQEQELILGIDKPLSPPKEAHWHRITLADGIELHIQDSHDKETQQKIERLRSFARSLFKKSHNRREYDE